MEAIAREVGITRRTVYLHFPSRADLLVGVVDHIDERGPLAELAADVWSSPTAREALDRFVGLNARYNPQIAGIARALSDAQAHDDAAATAWENRMKGRRDACRRLVSWLADDSLLTSDVSAADATDLLWALTGMRLWRDLVADRGWSARRYEQHLRNVLHRTLLR